MRCMSYHFSCAYHGNIPASVVCERCRKPICDSDVRMYIKTTKRGKYRRRELRRYCILCNAAVLQSDASLAQNIPPLVVLVIIAYIVAAYFHPIIALIIIVIAIFAYNDKKKKANRAAAEATRFQRMLPPHRLAATNTRPLSMMQQSPSSTTRLPTSSTTMHSSRATTVSTMTTTPKIHSKSPSSKRFVIVCFECGEKLLLTDRFCPNCGDSTQEELQAYYANKNML